MKYRSLIFAACCLVASSAFAARTWTGAAGNSWSAPGNWTPVGVPAAGESLAFPLGALTRSITIDAPAGTVLGPMIFGDTYTLGGNAVVLSGDVSSFKSVTWNGDVKLGANVNLSASGQALIAFIGAVDVNGKSATIGHVDFRGALSGGGTITVSGSDIPKISAVGSFNGLITGGPGCAITFAGNLPNASVQLQSFIASTPNPTIGDVVVGSGSYYGYYAPDTDNVTLHTKSFQALQEFDAFMVGLSISKVKVTGTVTLSNAYLFFCVLAFSNPPPQPGAKFLLIDNDGSDPVIGTFSGLPEGGIYSIGGASYSISYHGGDGNDVVATLVGPANTTTTLTQNVAQTTYHGPTMFTAKVTSNGGTPAGEVVLHVDNTTLPMGSLSGGSVTYTATAIEPGIHQVYAEFVGNAAFNTSKSTTLIHTVLQALNTPTIHSNVTSVVYGQPLELTVTVAAQTPSDGQPTGTVTVFADSTAIGGGVLVNGVATVNTSPIHAGSHELSAMYLGDARFVRSVSGTIPLTVAKAPTVLEARSNNTSVGVVVRPASGAAVVNAGSVSVMEGTTMLGTKSVTGGAADVALVGLKPGSHTLQVRYGGSDDFEPSNASLAFDLVVRTLSVDGVQIAEGNSGMTTVTVTVRLSSPATDTVRVSFATLAGSATEGVDYEKASGVLEFAPGQQTKSIELHIIGDETPELDETFSVVLSDPVNAILESPSAMVVIDNDDGGSQRRRAAKH